MQKNAVLAIGLFIALSLVPAGLATGAGERMIFVPWKVLPPGVRPSPDYLLYLYWVPASPEQMRHSELIMSMPLAQHAARCVAMYVIRTDDEQRLAAFGEDIELPLAVLSDVSGGELARVTHHKGSLRTMAVENMVRDEVRQRQAAAEQRMEAAGRFAAAREWSQASSAYQDVVAQRCAFPRLARAAQRALTKISSQITDHRSQ